MDHEGKVFEALASRVRREILWMIWDRELPAGQIAAAFDLRAPTISEHLSVLRQAGLVTMRKEGTFRRYRADRDAAAAIQQFLPDQPERFSPADDIPETGEATGHVVPLAVVSVDVAVPRPVAFAAFTDGDLYQRWLEVPVTLADGWRFAATMEWGTEIRGRYLVVVEPELIALEWDLRDEAVPVPGQAQPGYMRFSDSAVGCRVVVHQLAETHQHAEFLSIAWSMALGRFKQNAHLLGDTADPPKRRAPRPKNRTASPPPG